MSSNGVPGVMIAAGVTALVGALFAAVAMLGGIYAFTIFATRHGSAGEFVLAAGLAVCAATQLALSSVGAVAVFCRKSWGRPLILAGSGAGLGWLALRIAEATTDNGELGFTLFLTYCVGLPALVTLALALLRSPSTSSRET